MQGKLQQHYRVAREIERRARFEGDIPMDRLPRVRELLRDASAAEPVRLRFEFMRTPWGARSIRGHIRALLPMTCERCLQGMALAVDQPFELLIDARDEDESSGLEVIRSEDGWLDLFALVEEELILALPIIRRHEDVDCNEYWRPTEPRAAAETECDNPFAALAALKGKA